MATKKEPFLSLSWMESRTDTQALSATEDPATVRGTILDVQVPIYAQDSMMSIIQRACEEMKSTFPFDSRALISNESTDCPNLTEVGKWLERYLDGIFPNKSFAKCTVQNGEVKDQSVITVEYN